MNNFIYTDTDTKTYIAAINIAKTIYIDIYVILTKYTFNDTLNLDIEEMNILAECVNDGVKVKNIFSKLYFKKENELSELNFKNKMSVIFIYRILKANESNEINKVFLTDIRYILKYLKFYYPVSYKRLLNIVNSHISFYKIF